MGEWSFGTPRSSPWLFPAARLAQQFAIAAAHQGKSGLHQADGAVAQVMGFPGPLGDAIGAKQPLGDRAIAVALGSGIERAQRQGQSLSPLWGQFMKRGARGAPIERAPEPPCGVGANLEIHVERQFGGVRRADHQRFSQPKPVLKPTNTQQNVPAIGGLPEFAGGQFGQTERISVRRGCTLNNRNDCRQNFRCPEDGLILRRPRRVSRKSTAPILF